MVMNVRKQLGEQLTCNSGLRQRWKWRLAVIYSLMLIGFFVSCSRTPEVLTVAYQDRIGDASAILAAEKLSEADDFTWKIFSSGSMTAEALLTGSVDAATMGDAAAVSLASRYPDLITIIGIHGGGPERHRIVSRTTNPKTIGVKFGTSTHAALIEWLDKHGETAFNFQQTEEQQKSEQQPGNFLDLIDLSPDMQLSAFSSGEIDALAASEPTPSIALQDTEGLLVYPLILPGRGYPLVLAASKKSIEKNPESIKKLADTIRSEGALLQSGMHDLPLDYQRVLSQVTGLHENVLITSLRSHAYQWGTLSDYQNELQRLAEFMLSAGRISEIPNWKRVYWEDAL